MPEPVISVRGEASLEVEPEIAVVWVAVEARDADRHRAVELLAGRTGQVSDTIKGFGEAVEKLESQPVSVQPVFKDGKARERISGLHRPGRLHRDRRDFAVLGEFVTGLSDADLVTVTGPDWRLRPDSPVYRAARIAAAKEATRRAGEYAEAFGGRITGLVEAADTGLLAQQHRPVAFAARAAVDGRWRLRGPHVRLRAREADRDRPGRGQVHDDRPAVRHLTPRHLAPRYRATAGSHLPRVYPGACRGSAPGAAAHDASLPSWRRACFTRRCPCPYFGAMLGMDVAPPGGNRWPAPDGGLFSMSIPAHHDEFRSRRARPRTRALLAAIATVTGLATAAVPGMAAASAHAHGATVASAPAVVAYAYGDNPSARSYTPEKGFSFNSTGEGIRIGRSNTGTYTVRFFGLGAFAGQGTVDVTAEGLQPSQCEVVRWTADSTGSILLVFVDCFAVSGAKMDAPFMVAYTSGGSSTGTTDYVLANKPAAGNYTPAVPFQFNSSGGTNKITRIGTGQYQVKLPGPVVADGAVKVTAYGNNANSCQVVDWQGSAPGQNVFVDCFTPAGAAVNNKFTMTFTATDDLFGDGAPSGYLWERSTHRPVTRRAAPTSTTRWAARPP